MTDSLGSILHAKQFAEPPEIKIIKDCLQTRYGITPAVTVRQYDIIIEVPSAALAGTLRMQLHELQALCQTEKRLNIRIS